MHYKKTIKGRGAQQNTPNKFLNFNQETCNEFLDYCYKSGEKPSSNKTQYLTVFPKTIVNKIKSPDVGMQYSMNIYQGCEHGCVYCYARNSHEYWGFSAGLDFERKILIKTNAAVLLENLLKKKSWEAQTIVLSGNTDCYQPIEKKWELTRKCLALFLKYKHPVGIITKNALITRDLDILEALAKENLVVVSISVTSLSEKTRAILEPRTATIKKRLATITALSEKGIPVNAMLAPIIPAINSHEILPLAKAVANAGATQIAHTVVRLNGAIGSIFTDWLHKHLPDRAEKVIHQIESCHNGTLNDSRFNTRMRGEGKIAEQIHQQMHIARNKYFKNKKMPSLNTTLHEATKEMQLKLF